MDRNIYQTLPDYALQLTELGQEQAEDAGKRIGAIIGYTKYLLQIKEKES